MESINCSCAFKTQMIEEMQKMREENPGKETEWVNLLFPPTKKPEDSNLCCLLTYLFYYAYCKECKTPLSEEARTALDPLMGRQEKTIS